MPFKFLLRSLRPPPSAGGIVVVDGKSVPLLFMRHPRARRYVLRLRPDGTARVTVPRGGSEVMARQFAEKNADWLRQQMQRVATRTAGKTAWPVGTEIFYRGELVTIADGPHGISFAEQTLHVAPAGLDCRPAIERHLRRIAAVELPPRVFHFAQQHGLSVQRVTVRDQKSRWGSCSRRGTVSLNWRLIQTPAFVTDYIILHELMHLRQMNHSRKFWQEVEQVCPEFRVAEKWLKTHGRSLR
jgi:predicted metal-dependent hydrolase